MEFKKFKEILDSIRKADKFMDDAHKLGIDMIDSPVYEAMGLLVGELFTCEYGGEGSDWVSYVLYELPMIKEYDKDKPEKNGKKGYAWDNDGNVIDVESDEGLWNYLEKEYKIKKE